MMRSAGILRLAEVITPLTHAAPTVDSTATAIIAIVVILAAIAAALPYIRSAKLRATLEAKDEVIKTNEQSIEALNEKTRILDRQVNELTSKVNDLSVALDASIAEADRLREVTVQYSAPEAVKTFMSMFDTFSRSQEELMRHNLSTLEKIAQAQQRSTEIVEHRFTRIDGVLDDLHHRLGIKEWADGLS